MDSAATAPNGRICAACQGPGKLICSGCRLVVYCSGNCQKLHRGEHKQWCSSPLLQPTWKPGWVAEGRMPAFVGPPGQVLHGSTKYFWGNIPALDIIKLQANEGRGYNKDLNILFAASGDLRNIVKSVISLPEQYKNKACLFINDLDFEVVARNVIFTLIGLLVEDRMQAATCMLHLWYSALIRKSDIEVLRTMVLPLIEDVNRKIQGKASDAVMGKTWTFGKNVCRVELTKEKWGKLALYMQETAELSAQDAHHVRATVTLAPQRKDHRDRWLFSQQPAHRLSGSRFFDEGLLLPFGASRAEFVVPNPTFFQTSTWPMMDSANPLQGWSMPDVLGTDSGPATGDLYGKLFYHITEQLAVFHDCLLKRGHYFSFLNVNASALKDQSKLKGKTFARIDVSNISDYFYLGVKSTLEHLGVLLQSTKDNPHATLVALFMNAVPEMMHPHNEHPLLAEQARTLEMKRAMKFFNPLRDMSFSPYDPFMLKISSAGSHFRDFDRYFNSYMIDHEFKALEATSGTLLPGGFIMKQTHTVVEKWPLRLKLRHGQRGAQSELDVLQASGHVGHERYVEWKRGG